MKLKAAQELDPALVVAIGTLLLAELVCFGNSISKAGFYLDDWSMLASLHFGPQMLWAKLCSYFLDPRVSIRPLEAPYFVLLNLIFGLKPLRYHLLNGVFELAGGIFLYLLLARVTRNRSLSLIAALLFLVYPTHDATHYWFTASSINLSLALSLASLWQTIKGAQEHRLNYLWAGVGCFFLSIFNYEAFISWFVLNIACTWIFLPKPNRIKTIAPVVFGYGASIVALWLYRGKILPLLGTSWYNSVAISPANIIKTFSEGIRVNISPYAFSFFIDRIKDATDAGLHPINIAELAAFSIIVCASVYYLAQHKNTAPPCSIRGALSCTLLGGAATCLSLLLFGITPNYIPTLLTILNRINLGPSLGISLVIVGVIGLLVQIRKKQNFDMNPIIACLVLVPILNFFILTNWGLSQPWLLSWQTQKNIQQLLKVHASQFHSGDSIILADCPRYVQWAPLFDGVWDFQSTVQLLLNNQRIKANVVSERLHLTKDSIKDISAGCLCGEYPFHHLFVLIPESQEFIAVDSPQAFIQLVAERGMKFGLDPSTPLRWRKELAESL